MPSSSQINYAIQLIEGLRGRGTLSPTEDLSKAEIEGMTDREVSDLISKLKSQRGKPTFYGNGQFRGYEKRAAIPTELHVYDFDGTLFRSPLKPPGHTESWWADPMSLNSPCVTEAPGSDWWNGPIVSAAKKSIANPGVLAVLLTGRSDKVGGFRYRVPELLSQAGLDFDKVHMNGTGGSTEDFKTHKILNFLALYPSIRTVHIYEDREPHLNKFVKAVEKLGLSCVPHLVHVKAHDCVVAPAPTKTATPVPVYSGVFIEPIDLFRWWKEHVGTELLPKHFAHHMTIKFKPSLEEVKALPLGQEVNLQIVGWAEDSLSQAVAVSGFPSSNKHPHITVSTESTVSPVYSNDLVAKGTHKVHGGVIKGRVGFFAQGKVFYTV